MLQHTRTLVCACISGYHTPIADRCFIITCADALSGTQVNNMFLQMDYTLSNRHMSQQK